MKSAFLAIRAAVPVMKTQKSGRIVNSVAPSVVLTTRMKAKWETRPPEEQRAILAALPLRRLAMPEEVATVIAFLASDDASYVNGVCIDINGGSYMV